MANLGMNGHVINGSTAAKRTIDQDSKSVMALPNWSIQHINTDKWKQEMYADLQTYDSKALYKEVCSSTK